MSAEVIDQKARDDAKSALDKIEGHEGLCAERWSAARREMKNVRLSIWWLITTLVVGQGAVIILLAQAALK